MLPGAVFARLLLRTARKWRHVSCSVHIVPTTTSRNPSLDPIYRDRHHAGLVLAQELARFAEQSPLVIALPFGGVPVAHAVAQQLSAELDILLVHKFGVPGHPYISGGAVASDGSGAMNHAALGSFGVTPVALERALDKEMSELKRLENDLRSGRNAKPIAGRTVIVVDDGIATGTTIHAAIAALRAAGATKLVVAAPVASAQALEALKSEADDVVCPRQLHGIFVIGQLYEDFGPVSVAFAKELLQLEPTRSRRDRDGSEL
jgi:putative phosphoribosyl transferase